MITEFHHLRYVCENYVSYLYFTLRDDQLSLFSFIH